jgi:ATP-dependent DNA helicase RecQ
MPAGTPMADLKRAEARLHETFGFMAFRPGQDAIIGAILDGRDVLAVMPTGGGKSLCYQLPALLREGMTVVVSPLIALMRNQVAQLKSYGISAASLNSANEPGEARAAFQAMEAGTLRILYLAPERLALAETRATLARVGVSLLAIDEAHCVSQWGHDFRPEYMLIGEAAASLGNVQRIALTATADAATRNEIQAKLFSREPAIFVHGFDRPNLRLAMSPKNEARRQIVDFVKPRAKESGIVYCASRKQTEDLAAFLNGKGLRALPYHAGMDADARARNQDAFLQEDGLIMTATIAFGMGIDKPDVRFVMHANLPKSLEGYYQEIGRAGRDGLPADTLTLYGLDDIRLRRQQIEESEASDDQKRIEKQRLNALIALCEAPRCRRQTLLGYFGEDVAPCGNCDLCIDGVEVIDATILAQKALSAMARTGERFGSEHLIAILLGEETDKVRQFNHDKLPTFGVGKEQTKQEWRSLFRQLYAAGVINFDITAYGRWTITPRGRAVLKGAEKVELRREAMQTPGKTKAAKRASAPSQNLSDADRELFEALRGTRLRLAKEEKVAAFVILPDRSLLDMVHLKPERREQMMMVHGVGQAKLEKYGDIFLEVLKQHKAAVVRA